LHPILKTYYASGKVMLCGEYMVTAGMEALAFPVREGQWLKVWETESQGNAHLVWEASDKNGQVWLKAAFNTEIMHVTETTDEEKSAVLLSILQHIKEQQPGIFMHKLIRMETVTEFTIEHGLGTSSSLVVLLSQWSKLDAFEIQKAVFKGSGYDIAVAQTGRPIVYWLEKEEPSWAPFSLDSAWTENWFLVFTGKKINSRTSLDSVTSKIEAAAANPLFRWQLDQIGKGLKNPGNKIMLEAGLEMWQGMLSTLLGLKRTYDDLGIVPVPGGLCKYLGAWGGDVILVNKIVLDLYAPKFEGMERVKWNDYVIG
jgi:hypothetical protein